MNCTLMHERIPVAQMELDDATGFISKVYEVYVPEHLPVGISVKKGIADRAALNAWWTDRSIPASRSGVQEALETLDIADTKLLLVRCFGLSLSDQYWIRPTGTDLKWDDINFFDHAFSDDIGDILLGAKKETAEFDFSSPDNTSDGCLKKRWKILNGQRCLLKGGSNPFRQQPFNEVIASRIMDRLGIEHIAYDLIWDEAEPYSICQDFVTRDTELIGAWRIFQTQKKSNDVSVYQHYVNCCEALGIDVVPSLDRMIVVDYIIANEDRHLNNFGLIREAESLKWIGAAPIFDSGSSFGYDMLPFEILSGKRVTCKPFKNHHEEQLKLVSSFEWIDFTKLKEVGELIRSVFDDERAAQFIDKKRRESIVTSTEKRIQTLGEYAANFDGKSVIRSIEDDVIKNIAEIYVK